MHAFSFFEYKEQLSEFIEETKRKLKNFLL